MSRYSIAILLQAVCPILGVDAQKALSEADWSSADRPGADLSVSGRDFVAICHSIFRLAGERADPVLLGRSMANGPLLPIFLAFSIAPNAREGLNRMARYKTLFGPTALDLSSKNGGLRLEVIPDDPTLVLPDCLSVSIGVFLVEKCRSQSARHIVPHPVTLPAEALDMPGVAEFFGTAPKAGKGVVLEFSSTDITAPFLSENHALWLEIRRDLEGQLERQAGRGKFSNRVEAAIRRALTFGPVRADGICHELGVSRSTMQRRLKAEGKSYQDILDAVRKELAIRYLSKSALMPAEIAGLVGFSDPKSFHRAFKAWTSRPPAAFREQLEH